MPLGLAVDEEGGIVNRVSLYHRPKGKFPSPQEIYNESGIQGILDIDQEKRDLLRKFFLNVNLAPVADISYVVKDILLHPTTNYTVIFSDFFIIQMTIFMTEL